MPVKTTVVHCHRQPFDVYIGRSSIWGNPFLIGRDGDRATVIRKYRRWLLQSPIRLALIPREIKGRRLGCYCHPLPSHGDILAQLADQPER